MASNLLAMDSKLVANYIRPGVVLFASQIHLCSVDADFSTSNLHMISRKPRPRLSASLLVVIRVPSTVSWIQNNNWALANAPSQASPSS